MLKHCDGDRIKRNISDDCMEMRVIKTVRCIICPILSMLAYYLTCIHAGTRIATGRVANKSLSSCRDLTPKLVREQECYPIPGIKGVERSVATLSLSLPSGIILGAACRTIFNSKKTPDEQAYIHLHRHG